MKTVKFAILALGCVSCDAEKPAAHRAPEQYSALRFTLSQSKEDGRLFRGNLIQAIVGTRIRNDEVGLDGARFGDPKYVVFVKGRCVDAVKDVEPVVAVAASKFANKTELLEAYRANVTCSEHFTE